MIRAILKNTGKLIILLTVITFALPLYAAKIETTLSPSQIHEGEIATLKLMVSDATSDITPLKVPGVRGLNISFRGSTRSFQFVNGKSWSGTILNFSVYGEKKGNYTIPSFLLDVDGQKLESRKVELTVLAGSVASGGGTSQEAVTTRGVVEFASNSVVVGEPLIVRYFLYYRGGTNIEIEGIRHNPESRGFLVKKIDEHIPDSEIVDGDSTFIKSHVATYCFIPVEAGSFFSGGGSILLSHEVFIRGPFAMPSRREIEFPKKTVNVRALPEKGKPNNFRGDVGEFTIKAKPFTNKVKLYDEVRVPVIVSGKGNLITLSKPELEKKISARVIFEEGDVSIKIEENSLSGEKNYFLTFIPDNNGSVELGRISIPCYNLDTQSYETIYSEPIVFEVEGVSTPKNKEGEVKFDNTQDSMNFSIPLLIAILVIVSGTVLFVVLWERKKYEVVVNYNSKPDNDVEVKEESKDKIKDLIYSMGRAIKEGDDDAFLRYADISLKYVDEQSLSSENRNEIIKIKDIVYACRYGSGRPGSEELRNIYMVLKKNLKG